MWLSYTYVASNARYRLKQSIKLELFCLFFFFVSLAVRNQLSSLLLMLLRSLHEMHYQNNISTKMLCIYTDLLNFSYIFWFYLFYYRFMLRRTKPDYSTSHSARLTEDVLADDRDDYDYLMQTSTVW